MAGEANAPWRKPGGEWGRHTAPAYYTSKWIAVSRRNGDLHDAFSLLVQQLRGYIGQLRRKFTSLRRDGGWHNVQTNVLRMVRVGDK